ncbi:MAG: oxygen-independent coproporphyrinogen III oxidase [Marinibacterium sp.]|nr:oxygen-independent coproporphyrinogen III oxidase [Marinibacterium sp.]
MVTKTEMANLGLFDARVPRYTSYPTSPHFNAATGPAQFASWLSEIPAGTGVSLYVHVPFCRRLCWFCACRTQGTQSDAPVRAYLETLKTDLAHLRGALPQGLHLARLHWGGGTPTLMTPDMISDLAEAINAVLPITQETEFSVEIDPNEIDAPRLAALKAAGMNRASIGIQDFDPSIQEVIGRRQSFDLTRDTIDMIRDLGVHSLNADILYGLPHQTRTKITDSVQKLLSLSPDRVALYGYAHVPWMARRQSMLPSDALPTPQERLNLFDTARRLLVWDNYTEIGIDHFAQPSDGLAIAARTGHLRRNFQGYTDDTSDVLIGVGASAISKFPGGYAQNAPATSAYTAAVRDGQFATARGHVFSGEDRMRARMIEALMCDFRIDRADILRDHDITPQGLSAMLEGVADAFPRMLTLTEDALFIPPEARAMTRMIARAFDAYELSKAGHSSAI